ncbi:MAG: class I SAM-dependent methyltransferase [Bryobacteraceae bacterium]|jgi:O-methyltransferase involved in polyketide biosynthesis
MYAELRRCAPERPAAPLAQLVILGAGFDTRAWRLEALAGATVFDVDHAVGGCGVTVYLRPEAVAANLAALAALSAPGSHLALVGEPVRSAWFYRIWVAKELP